ncbi:MAG TPA: metallophosphoesterase [Amaricoccus sp.]|uniref:metallophosphoesterase n=1 Tax=Amaricoccus sp. TaxID=1872485 RepID=UPI002CE04D03|nr:metallophosphoesterase [Amaricoccus sp.]HMR31273.1 metallophosphoesterase [Geminicoccus sp.]HMU00269.1 metallophosphoesterase [Amaricoccus sp.]
MLIAHLTDLHIRAGREPSASWRDLSKGGLDAIVDRIVVFNPPIDAMALTGDLADSGTAEDYELLLRPLRRLRMPLLPIVGNHDMRAPMRAAFGELLPSPQPEGWIQYAVDIGPLRVVALDTLKPDHAQGELCAGRLAWAEQAMAQDRPTLLLLHHPPIPLGIEGMDASRLLTGVTELGDIVQRHPHMVGILCGHYHRPVVSSWLGVPLLVAASPALQLGLCLDEGDAPAVDEPYGMFLHRWTRESGLVTHSCFLPLPR